MSELRQELLEYSYLFEFLGDRVHMDGAYDKMFARINDPRFPLRLLPPYSCVSEEQFQTFEAALRHRCPKWLPVNYQSATGRSPAEPNAALA